MFPIILIVLVVLIVLALFLLESEIGMMGCLKSITLVIVGIFSGYGIYYCLQKLNDRPINFGELAVDEPKDKDKWGGLGIGELCSGGDDKFHRIATDKDIDVQAFHKGMNVYADLTNDMSGDSQLALRSQFQAGKNKQAVINRSNYTANNIKQYFEDELEANEKKVWWDDDELDALV